MKHMGRLDLKRLIELTALGDGEHNRVSQGRRKLDEWVV